jgi:hypothetical protein
MMTRRTEAAIADLNSRMQKTLERAVPASSGATETSMLRYGGDWARASSRRAIGDAPAR